MGDSNLIRIPLHSHLSQFKSSPIMDNPVLDESTSFASRIPLNREFNELEKYCDPCSFKDGLPLYKYRPEFVQFMRNEVLDRVLSQRDFVVESPTSAIELMPKQTRLSPPEWIEVFRHFIEKGYYVYRIENKLILTAKRVLNPLPLIENTYILEYYEGGEKSYRSYPFGQESKKPPVEKTKFKFLESLRKLLHV